MRPALALALAITIAAFASPSPAQDGVEAGKGYFMDSGCYGCHVVGKMGTPIGPDLSRVGTKYSRTYLELWLRDPSAQRPNAHMPRLELSEQQTKALADFFRSHGVLESTSWATALSGKGWWRLAESPAAKQAMDLRWFEALGLVNLVQRYVTLNS